MPPPEPGFIEVVSLLLTHWQLGERRGHPMDQTWPGSSSSSLTSTRAWWQRSPVPIRRLRINGIGSTSSARLGPRGQGRERNGRRGVPHDIRPSRPGLNEQAVDKIAAELAARHPNIGALMNQAKAEVLAFPR